MKTKGMVVKIKGSTCIVLAGDGTYHKVSLAGRKGVRIGAEIEFSTSSWLNYVKPALMVASIIIALLGFGLFQNTVTPEAYAYISLDINPSVEIAVAEDLKVLHVYSVNSDAEKLLADMKLQNTDLYECIDAILAKSVQDGYLQPGQKAYVLSTVTLKDSSSPEIVNYDNFTGTIRAAVENKGLNVDLVVMSTEMALRNEARSKGFSTGKLAVYKDAIKAGQELNLQQVKDHSVTELVYLYKIKLLPNSKKIIVKSVHIPPGQVKKDTDKNDLKPDQEEKDNPAAIENKRERKQPDDRLKENKNKALVEAEVEAEGNITVPPVDIGEEENQAPAQSGPEQEKKREHKKR